MPCQIGDELFSKLVMATMRADEIAARYACPSENMRIAVSKDIYQLLVRSSSPQTLSFIDFGFFHGYQICVINDDNCNNKIIPLVIYDRTGVFSYVSANIGNYVSGDHIAFLNGCDGIATIHKLREINGMKLFDETDMTVMLYHGAGDDSFRVTEEEVDAFLSEYKKEN